MMMQGLVPRGYAWAEVNTRSSYLPGFLSPAFDFRPVHSQAVFAGASRHNSLALQSKERAADEHAHTHTVHIAIESSESYGARQNITYKVGSLCGATFALIPGVRPLPFIMLR
eukprot:gnl/TRDRNA2_/TRDRNA2_133677_c0_seq2.p2 gnl/TRDRNA2_/TRDRNA2_133677_c0~~gnl/TRDRNA2_/TRDRNA2_133677_c0_seq2.p2  ORF type:complete len:113 (-),score=1.20 gnl/TRDRNA2_/TRDRNA2_133677_c0_seq2:6-344(-)